MVTTENVNSTTGEKIKEGFVLAADAPIIPGTVSIQHLNARIPENNRLV